MFGNIEIECTNCGSYISVSMNVGPRGGDGYGECDCGATVDLDMTASWSEPEEEEEEEDIDLPAHPPALGKDGE